MEEEPEEELDYGGHFSDSMLAEPTTTAETPTHEGAHEGPQRANRGSAGAHTGPFQIITGAMPEWEPSTHSMMAALRAEHLERERCAQRTEGLRTEEGNEPGTSSVPPASSTATVPELHTPYDWVVAFGGIPP